MLTYHMGGKTVKAMLRLKWQKRKHMLKPTYKSKILKEVKRFPFVSMERYIDKKYFKVKKQSLNVSPEWAEGSYMLLG